MKISELIAELKKQQEQNGDVDVEIHASYDCGYGEAGGDIQEIEMKTIHKPIHGKNGECVWEDCAILALVNHEG